MKLQGKLKHLLVTIMLVAVIFALAKNTYQINQIKRDLASKSQVLEGLIRKNEYHRKLGVVTTVGPTGLTFDAGSSVGIEVGDVFGIHKEGDHIAKIQVRAVNDETSIADVVGVFFRVPKPGDDVLSEPERVMTFSRVPTGPSTNRRANVIPLSFSK